MEEANAFIRFEFNEEDFEEYKVEEEESKETFPESNEESKNASNVNEQEIDSSQTDMLNEQINDFEIEHDLDQSMGSQSSTEAASFSYMGPEDFLQVRLNNNLNI